MLYMMTHNQASWCNDNSLDAVFRMSDIQITAGIPAIMVEIFWWFFSILPSKFQDGVGLLSSKSFPIYV